MLYNFYCSLGCPMLHANSHHIMNNQNDPKPNKALIPKNSRLEITQPTVPPGMTNPDPNTPPASLPNGKNGARPILDGPIGATHPDDFAKTMARIQGNLASEVRGFGASYYDHLQAEKRGELQSRLATNEAAMGEANKELNEAQGKRQQALDKVITPESRWVSFSAPAKAGLGLAILVGAPLWLALEQVVFGHFLVGNEISRGLNESYKWTFLSLVGGGGLFALSRRKGGDQSIHRAAGIAFLAGIAGVFLSLALDHVMKPDDNILNIIVWEKRISGPLGSSGESGMKQTVYHSLPELINSAVLIFGLFAVFSLSTYLLLRWLRSIVYNDVESANTDLGKLEGQINHIKSDLSHLRNEKEATLAAVNTLDKEREHGIEHAVSIYWSEKGDAGAAR